MGTLYYGDNLPILPFSERPSTVAATDETFKKAPESKKKRGEQSALGL